VFHGGDGDAHLGRAVSYGQYRLFPSSLLAVVVAVNNNICSRPRILLPSPWVGYTKHILVPLHDNLVLALEEMCVLTRLSLHRSNACIHEEQPIVHLIVLPGAFGETDLVFWVIAIYEILHDASRLEEVDGFAIGKGVGYGRDATIGVNGAEPWLFLRVFADVDLVGFIGDTARCQDVYRFANNSM
jgi:hypothetical protein